MWQKNTTINQLCLDDADSLLTNDAIISQSKNLEATNMYLSLNEMTYHFWVYS